MSTADTSELHTKLDQLKNKTTLIVAIASIVGFAALGIAMIYTGCQSFAFVLSGRAKDWFSPLLTGIFLVGPGIPLVILTFRTLYETVAYKSFLKKMYNYAQIDPRLFRTAGEEHLYRMVERVSEQMGVAVPELGIYPSYDLNALAYSFTPKRSVVLISDSLVDPGLYDKQERPIKAEARVTPGELEAIIAHEIGHIRSGDSLATTLLTVAGETCRSCLVAPWKGIIAIAMFFVTFSTGITAFETYEVYETGWGGRKAVQTTDSLPFKLIGLMMAMMFGVFALFASAFYFGGQIIYVVISQLLQCGFSRKREYRADAAAALAVGTEPMIGALTRIYKAEYTVPKNFGGAVRAFHNPHSLTGGSKVNGLLANIFPDAYRTHPQLLERIEALNQGTYIPG